MLAGSDRSSTSEADKLSDEDFAPQKESHNPKDLTPPKKSKHKRWYESQELFKVIRLVAESDRNPFLVGSGQVNDSWAHLAREARQLGISRGNSQGDSVRVRVRDTLRKWTGLGPGERKCVPVELQGLLEKLCQQRDQRMKLPGAFGRRRKSLASLDLDNEKDTNDSESDGSEEQEEIEEEDEESQQEAFEQSDTPEIHWFDSESASSSHEFDMNQSKKRQKTMDDTPMSESDTLVQMRLKNERDRISLEREKLELKRMELEMQLNGESM